MKSAPDSASVPQSPIPWLPEVPEGWTLVRNKAFLRLTDEKVGERKQDFPLLSLSKQGVIIRDVSEGKGKFPKDFDTYLVVRPNNLVFCLFDIEETPRTVGLVKNVGMLTGAYTNFEVNQSIVLPQFAYYYYLFVDDGKRLAPYYTGLRKVVKTNTFFSLMFPLPPLPEQRAIVAFLDEKCAKIDQLIAAKKREVELLRELKQAIIAEEVTGAALERNRPTGVFWQPSMPDGWRVRKLRHVLKKLDRERKEGAELLVCTNKGEVVKRGDAKIGLVSEDESIYQGVAKGDLLIHGMDTWHGAIAVSNLDGMCTPVVHVCDSSEDKRFIAYCLQNMARGRLFKLISNGVRQNTSDFRSWEKVAQLPIVLPPLPEQRKIVAYIEAKTAKIDTLVAKLGEEVARLKEYRERLIADVVTGKRRIAWK